MVKKRGHRGRRGLVNAQKAPSGAPVLPCLTNTKVAFCPWMGGGGANSGDGVAGTVCKESGGGMLVRKPAWLPAQQQGQDGTDEGALFLLALS